MPSLFSPVQLLWACFVCFFCLQQAEKEQMLIKMARNQPKQPLTKEAIPGKAKKCTSDNENCFFIKI